MDAAAAAPLRTPEDQPVPVSVDRLFSLAARDMAGVDALILEHMQSEVGVIPALAEHLISAGGKRLRPLLTVAAARAAGARSDEFRKLAAAVEFIHTATLLHDDVVDSSSLRRGKVAAHLIWGAPSSVLVGDFLFSRAFELMVSSGSMAALEILARASRVISEGEVMQLTRSHDLSLAKDVYLEIIAAKTAELFAAAAEAGAVAACASTQVQAAFRGFGMNVGLAFQLIDDALDYSSSAETLGKNVGDDFREGKATLPLLLAVARSGPSEAAFWERAVGDRQQGPGDFEHALSLIETTGALATTLDLAHDYADQAKRALAGVGVPVWRDALCDLADFAVSRTA